MPENKPAPDEEPTPIGNVMKEIKYNLVDNFPKDASKYKTPQNLTPTQKSTPQPTPIVNQPALIADKSPEYKTPKILETLATIREDSSPRESLFNRFKMGLFKYALPVVISAIGAYAITTHSNFKPEHTNPGHYIQPTTITSTYITPVRIDEPRIEKVDEPIVTKPLEEPKDITSTLTTKPLEEPKDITSTLVTKPLEKPKDITSTLEAEFPVITYNLETMVGLGKGGMGAVKGGFENGGDFYQGQLLCMSGKSDSGHKENYDKNLSSIKLETKSKEADKTKLNLNLAKQGTALNQRKTIYSDHPYEPVPFTERGTEASKQKNEERLFSFSGYKEMGNINALIGVSSYNNNTTFNQHIDESINFSNPSIPSLTTSIDAESKTKIKKNTYRFELGGRIGDSELGLIGRHEENDVNAWINSGSVYNKQFGENGIGAYFGNKGKDGEINLTFLKNSSYGIASDNNLDFNSYYIHPSGSGFEAGSFGGENYVGVGVRIFGEDDQDTRNIFRKRRENRIYPECSFPEHKFLDFGNSFTNSNIPGMTAFGEKGKENYAYGLNWNITNEISTRWVQEYFDKSKNSLIEFKYNNFTIGNLNQKIPGVDKPINTFVFGVELLK